MSTPGSPVPAEPTPKGKWSFLEKVPWNLVAGLIALIIVLFIVKGTVMTYWPPTKDGGASSTVKLENELKELREKYEKLIADSAADTRELDGWRKKKAELDEWQKQLKIRQAEVDASQKLVTTGLAKIKATTSKMEEMAQKLTDKDEEIVALKQQVKDLTAQLKGGKK